MSQILRPENFKLTLQSTTVVRLPSGSIINLGGLQYNLSSNIDLSVSSLTANTLYMVYLVSVAGVLTLVNYTNVNSAGPAGYTYWKLVGAFQSNSTTTIGGLVNITGIPTTDWMDCGTTTYNSGGTKTSSGLFDGTWIVNTSYTGFMRRVGANIECQAKIGLSGAPTAVILQLNMPSGVVIDTNKQPSDADSANYNIGLMNIDDFGTNYYNGLVRCVPSSNRGVYPGIITTAAAYASPTNISATIPITFAINDYILLNFIVPIVGWSNTPLIEL